MSSRNQLDLDILPEEARKEIEDFYEFLLKKYRVKEKKRKIDIGHLIPAPIKKFKPLTRDEIYGR